MNDFATTARQVWYAPGRNAPLGRCIGRGGEGAVYDFGRGLVKLYRAHVTGDAQVLRAIRRKIEAMCRSTAFRDDVRYAWPLFPVFRDRDCREFAGFAMSKKSGVSLQAVCTLRTLRETFPTWNRLDVAHVALALLDALIALEAAKILPGDVSPNNFLVDGTGNVSCLDVDSYQFCADGELHKCGVITPMFAPLELLDNQGAGLERTSYHLRFSVGLLVYHVLTYGCSPYMTTWGDCPISNLRKGKTAMGGSSGRASAFVPRAIFQRYMDLDRAAKAVCLKTFIDGHHDPAARPPLEAWRAAVERHIWRLKQRIAA